MFAFCVLVLGVHVFMSVCLSVSQELFVREVLPELVEEVYIKEGKKGAWKRQQVIGKRSGLFYWKMNRSEVNVIK